MHAGPHSCKDARNAPAQTSICLTSRAGGVTGQRADDQRMNTLQTTNVLLIIIAVLMLLLVIGVGPWTRR